MQQVSSTLHKHTNRKQKDKQTHMLLEETSAPKWEREPNRTPRTRNVNTAPSTPNTFEDTHLPRKTAGYCGSDSTQSNTFFFVADTFFQAQNYCNATYRSTEHSKQLDGVITNSKHSKVADTHKADSTSKTDSAKESEEAKRKRRQPNQLDRTHDGRLITIIITMCC